MEGRGRKKADNSLTQTAGESTVRHERETRMIRAKVARTNPKYLGVSRK